MHWFERIALRRIDDAAAKGELAPRYAEFIGHEIQKAYLESYHDYGQNLFDRYIDYADAWIEDQDFKDPDTGQLLDRELLNQELTKIEKPAAVRAFPEILKVSDGIMVARGDLGVELPVHSVPPIQKRLTRACRAAAKPVIVATQMLESMISAPVPTRAEVSDVSIAVYEGADAVMLSAESAAGDYPVEAVETMDRIAVQVERDPLYASIISAQRSTPEATGADAVSLAARQMAETLSVAAIVTYTSTGNTGLRTARERPLLPIIALSPKVATARRLSIAWGLHCVVTEDATDLEGMVDKACRVAVEQELARPGERVIVTAGVPLGTPGATNMLRIAYIGSDGLSAV